MGCPLCRGLMETMWELRAGQLNICAISLRWLFLLYVNLTKASAGLVPIHCSVLVFSVLCKPLKLCKEFEIPAMEKSLA